MKFSEKNKTIQILFPCVHGLANGQLVTINCFPSVELKSTIKAVTGVDEEIAARIIGASRYGETDGRAGIGVMALFSNPLFNGESYGLALAIADKMARFENENNWTEIYATGSIPADGCGRVKAVGGFSEKIELLLDKAKPGSLFIYPKENNVSDQIKKGLDLLQEKKVMSMEVDAVDDLQGFLWESNRDNKSVHIIGKIVPASIILPAIIWKAILGVCFAGIAGFLVYFTFNTITHNSAQKWINQGPLNNNKNNEVTDTFSHQEIIQKERISGGTDTPHSDEPVHKQRGQGASDIGPQRKPVILESTDTDSSLY